MTLGETYYRVNYGYNQGHCCTGFASGLYACLSRKPVQIPPERRVTPLIIVRAIVASQLPQATPVIKNIYHIYFIYCMTLCA